MSLVRWLLIVACCGAVLYALWHCPWQGRLQFEGTSYLVEQTPAPLWAGPPLPTHADFAENFGSSPGFPAADAPGVAIDQFPKVGWMVTGLLLLWWPILVVAGLLYLTLRGRRFDFVLHVALLCALCLTGAIVLCIAVWLIAGGGTPPGPEYFGLAGLMVGIGTGIWSYPLQRQVG